MNPKVSKQPSLKVKGNGSQVIITGHDRFIPRVCSEQAYKAFARALQAGVTSSRGGASSSMDNLSEGEVSFHLANGNISARQTSIPTGERGEGTDQQDDQQRSSSPSTSFEFDDIVAEALGFNGAMSRILSYRSLSSSSNSDHRHLESCDRDKVSKNSKEKKNQTIPSVNPFKVLDSRGLRDDFYTNLISCSKKTDQVAVGLYNKVYIWSETRGATPLITGNNEIISCVSFSDDDFVCVGTQSGTLLLFEANHQAHLAATHNARCLCCIAWMADSSCFITGDETGEVSIYQILKRNDRMFLEKSCSFRYHMQQICGIAISKDMQQVAIGCNDNICSIWDVKNRLSPSLKFLLPHQAAIKAIAYCPWSTALLATGGGSKDRTIKFWHSHTGTLLSSHNTSGQITSLIWSSTKRQLCATFGFTDSSNPMLIGVFAYPKMNLVMKSNASANLRALSASVSADGSKICIAVNDETVRFYELWTTGDHHLTPEAQREGIFGSELLELSEKVLKTPERWR